jgi:mannose-6-phosphate isomerase-like protein (cupin superfamily)
MQIIEGAGRWVAPDDGSTPDWTEQLRVPHLSIGTYCIAAGGTDEQSPHTEDEVYVVTSGRARIVTPSTHAEVAPGSVIFVPAGEAHRFVDVLEDLTLLVVFGPAYGSRATYFVQA